MAGNPSASDDRRERPKTLFQFSIWRLLLLLFFSALALALIRRMDASLSVRVVMAVYAILLLGYLILRFPTILQRIGGNSAEMREIRRQRLDAMQQCLSQSPSPDEMPPAAAETGQSPPPASRA